jgi:hypothetical protein
MSYNIDSSTEIKLDAWMYAKDVVAFLREHGDSIPECTFLNETTMEEEAKRALEAGNPRAKIKLPNFWWYGEGSGHAYTDLLLPVVCPLVHGYAEIIFTWEGGDSHTGLIVDNGKAEERDVVMTLSPKKRK